MTTGFNNVGVNVDRDTLRMVNAALADLPKALRKKVINKAIKNALLHTMYAAVMNMPQDESTAAQALRIRKAPAKGRRKKQVRYVVDFKTAKIRKKSGNDFFYPAVIEYGSETLHREPVAPMRRAFEATKELAGADAQRQILAEVDQVIESLNKT